jgi:small membrane protein
MGIRIALIASILLVSWWFLRQRNTSRTQAGKKILLVLFACLAIVMIVDPTLTDAIARFLGVGRGADLLLYALVVAFLYVTINSYLKFKELEDRNIELARRFAVEGVIPPPGHRAERAASWRPSTPPRPDEPPADAPAVGVPPADEPPADEPPR